MIRDESALAQFQGNWRLRDWGGKMDGCFMKYCLRQNVTYNESHRECGFDEEL